MADPVEELREERWRRGRCACTGLCRTQECPSVKAAREYFQEHYPAALRAKYFTPTEEAPMLIGDFPDFPNSGSERSERPLCGATDGLGLWADEGDPDRCYGRCNLPAGHGGDERASWHREMRDGSLWAEWRGPNPGVQCNVCGKDGCEH